MSIKCLFGHKWNGCKCGRCGEIRDEQHDWDLCKGKCKRCGKTQAEQHDWNGCKCTRCGKTRDEQHDWKGTKCNACGKIRDINTITDQSVLSDIAQQHDEDCRFRMLAAHKLTDQTLAQAVYADVAKYCKYSDSMRELAVEVLTDQSVLAYVAINDECAWVCRPALEKLIDQNLIADVAKNAKKEIIRKFALGKLIDKSLINKVEVSQSVKKDVDGKIDIEKAVREFAVYRDLSLEQDKTLDEMENKLLAAGENIEVVIFEFLARCGMGLETTNFWWNNADRLVKLISRINSSKTKFHLEELVKVKHITNIWEYHTKVVAVAEEELKRRNASR